MQVLHTSEALTTWADRQRADGLVVGLVPTMGFLHRGHASLMDRLRERCNRLVVSIYVNPIQFGATYDKASIFFDRYPRDLEGDHETCRAHGGDAVFVPDSLYPPGFSTRVRVDGLTEGLCGASRPTHFEGVTTVVASADVFEVLATNELGETVVASPALAESQIFLRTEEALFCIE